MTLAEIIIARLQAFNEKLERGEPIKATRVVRHETPDGPMHEFRKITLKPKR